ncbi:MAG: heparan-alpha-glucosaminide N-acetyltransferase domain-containing protein, partial [Chthoniobacterales bacterium]
MAEVTQSAIPIRPASFRPRLDHLDLLRGAVIVLMASDPTRDFFSNDALTFEPTDLSRTSVALFFTRWITHFCAPVFCFLAGTGAFLSSGRGKTKAEVAKFLVSRGLWLVLLELTWMQISWRFNFDFHDVDAATLWALGWSMVVLAGLI